MVVWLLFIVCTAGLAACGDGGPAPQAAGGDKVSAGSENGAYPLQIVDATGKTHVFNGAPQRIVTISPAETEILFALGLDERIVAVSDYDDYPPETASKERVGGIIDPNEEALIAVRPDLIVAGISLDPNVTDRLRQLGLPVIQLKADHLEDVYHNIEVLGRITNRQEEAERLLQDMRMAVRDVTEKVQHLREEEKKKVYVEISPGWTVGGGTYLDELLAIAGGINVAGDLDGWNMINEEVVIAADPDVILYARGLIDFDSGRPMEEIIRSRSGWGNIRAVRDGRVIGVEENLIARPGPRLPLALQEIAGALYPELFAEGQGQQ
jgi:iron complex transport system substrate-binding protein